jgi:hypothetical protein
MADFNSFPAMQIQAPQMGPGLDLANVFGNVEKVKAMRDENALAPLRAQAMMQQNALQSFAMQQAQQAGQYANVNRQLETLGATAPSDLKAAEAQWKQIMSSFPEGKQWGEFSIDKLDRAQKLYGGKAVESAGKARGAYATAIKQADGFNLNVLGAGAVPGGGGGGGESDLGGEPLTASQMAGASKWTPQQTMAEVQKYNTASERLHKILTAKDAEEEWKREQDMYPDFPRGEFNLDKVLAMKATVDARRAQMAGLESNAQLGIPNPRGAYKAAGSNIFDEYSGEFKQPPPAPETQYQKDEIANQRERLKLDREIKNKDSWEYDYNTEGEDGKQVPVLHSKNTGAFKTGDIPVGATGKYQPKAGAGGGGGGGGGLQKGNVYTDGDGNYLGQGVFDKQRGYLLQKQDGTIGPLPSDARPVGVSDPSKIPYYADALDDGTIATIAQVPKDIQPAVLKYQRDKVEEESGGKAPGTVGSAAIDNTTDGYYTKKVRGAGSLTQAAIDDAGMVWAVTGGLPTGLGQGNAGAAGARKDAVQARGSEMKANGNIIANKAEAQSLSKSLSQQVTYANTVERSVKNADAGLKHLVDTYGKRIPDMEMPIANFIARKGEYNFTPGDIAAFHAGLQEVRTEYQQVIARAGQLSDKVRDQAEHVLDGNLSMNDLQKVHEELQAQGKIIIDGSHNQANDIHEKLNNIISGGSKAPEWVTLPNGVRIREKK